MTPDSLSVLIPLFNEEEFIQELLRRVVLAPLPGGLDRELIVVDDCSTDGSIQAVECFIASHPDVRIRLIRHDKNRGKGAAIRTAIEAATGLYSVIQDADLEYDPREYSKLLGPLLNGEADVVYGSRFLAAESGACFISGTRLRIISSRHSATSSPISISLTWRPVTRPSEHRSFKRFRLRATASELNRAHGQVRPAQRAHL